MRRGIIRVADLFAGAGGMTVGLGESARRHGLALEIPLAVESDPDVAAIYKLNLPNAKLMTADLSLLFDGAIGAQKTSGENKLLKQAGHCEVLLGGPPCQGHSDLNNHTRREDPKNSLYLLMARAAEVLDPDVVVIENVPPVQWDKGKVVDQTKATLRARGYVVDGRVVDLRRVGVPQRRHRFLLLASKVERVVPTEVLDNLEETLGDHAARDVRWAIGDLEQSSATTTFDSASQPSSTNLSRIKFLFDNDAWDLPNPERPDCHKDGDHSYVSMYGRLHWDQPAQTVTTGFGSMGQGRYVHPSCQRTITPHEAARLQTFPDWFEFGEHTRRGVLAKVIGNAVPPLLMLRLGELILPNLDASTAIASPTGDHSTGRANNAK